MILNHKNHNCPWESLHFNVLNQFSSTNFFILIVMGGIQRAGTGKNKKVTEISPLLAFWPEGLGVKFL
jgi:hypothetical protein